MSNKKTQFVLPFVVTNLHYNGLCKAFDQANLRFDDVKSLVVGKKSIAFTMNDGKTLNVPSGNPAVGFSVWVQYCEARKPKGLDLVA